MKIFISFLFIFAVSNTFAQGATSGDLVEIKSMSEMPFPLPTSEVTKMQKGKITRAPDGFSSIESSPEIVNSFFGNLNRVNAQVANKPNVTLQHSDILRGPEAQKDLTTLKLTFQPSTFNRCKLIGAVPTGTLLNNAWTGVERFYQLEGVGTVRISEIDLGASGGKFYMLREAVNTVVNGKQAISKVFIDGNNQSVEEIVWVNGTKMHTLTYAPNIDSASSIKRSANQAVSAFSLAQELD
jgi:hypothetical protein